MQEEQFVEQPEIVPELTETAVDAESSPESDTPEYDSLVSDDTMALAETESDALAEDTERYEDAATALEAYIDLLQQAGPDGISRQSAAILNAGLNQVYKTLGLETHSTGLESYISCSPRDRMYNVVVSVEDIKQKAKDAVKWLWEKIIKAAKALFAFGESLVGKVAQVYNKAKELAEAIKSNKTVAGVEFELPNILATALHASIQEGDTLDNANTAELQMIQVFVVDIPKAVTEMFLATASGNDFTPEASPVNAIFKSFKESFILANGLEILSFKDDDSEEWNIATKSHPFEGETLSLKTRSGFEMAKSLKTTMAVLEVYKDKATQSFKRVAEATDKAYGALKISDELKAEANREHIAHMSRYLANPLHRQVTSTILNIAKAKIAAIGLELEASKTATSK